MLLLKDRHLERLPTSTKYHQCQQESDVLSTLLLATKSKSTVGKITVNVVLKEDVFSLKLLQLVTVFKRKACPGSVASVKAESLKSMPVSGLTISKEKLPVYRYCKILVSWELLL